MIILCLVSIINFWLLLINLTITQTAGSSSVPIPHENDISNTNNNQSSDIQRFGDISDNRLASSGQFVNINITHSLPVVATISSRPDSCEPTIGGTKNSNTEPPMKKRQMVKSLKFRLLIVL